MAKKHHPDVNKENPEAEKKFQEVQQAYEVRKYANSVSDSHFVSLESPHFSTFTRGCGRLYLGTIGWKAIRDALNVKLSIGELYPIAYMRNSNSVSGISCESHDLGSRNLVTKHEKYYNLDASI